MLADSCWSTKGQKPTGSKGSEMIIAEKPDKDCVYPFGLDYFWMQSD